MRLSGHKTSSLSDNELIAAFKDSGDLDVLGELYASHMHLVYGVCLKYLANRDDAQDAVMQIFEKLIVELPKHQIENFKSWLYVLTKNHCFMELRSRKSQGRREEGLKNDPLFMESDEELHPLDKEEASMDDALKACLENLKTEQKQCIELFYYQGKSYRDIAGLLALEEKKVKSFIQNGKRNLKICLEETHERP